MSVNTRRVIQIDLLCRRSQRAKIAQNYFQF